MRRNKFGAKKCYCNGIRFDSMLERDRYVVLLQLEEKGKISDIEVQPSFDLSVNGIHVCNYKADFVYTFNGARVYEDAKGIDTRDSKLRRLLVKAIYGIDVQVIKRENVGAFGDIIKAKVKRKPRKPAAKIKPIAPPPTQLF